MDLEIFPFGKYKGYQIKELPTTYIVLAIEQFYLPTELTHELRYELLGRLKSFTYQKDFLKQNGLKKSIQILSEMSEKYERPEYYPNSNKQ